MLTKRAIPVLTDNEEADAVTYEDFEEWVKYDEEIQNFLIKFVGFHPIEAAITRYGTILQHLMQGFDEAHKQTLSLYKDQSQKLLTVNNNIKEKIKETIKQN